MGRVACEEKDLGGGVACEETWMGVLLVRRESWVEVLHVRKEVGWGRAGWECWLVRMYT